MGRELRREEGKKEGGEVGEQLRLSHEELALESDCVSICATLVLTMPQANEVRRN